MPREVVGAELVAGIVAELREVLRPLRHLAPPASREVRVPFGLRHRRKRDEHIAAFLHRHAERVIRTAADGLPLLHAVVLPFRHGIEAEVVRGVRVGPFVGRGVDARGRERRLREREARQEQVRQLRVEYVRRADHAARAVLGGHQKRLAVRVRHEGARGEALPPGELRDRGVFRAADRLHVAPERVVERAALRLERRRVADGLGEHRVERLAAAPPPVHELRPEEPYVLHVVIGEQVGGG